MPTQVEASSLPLCPSHAAPPEAQLGHPRTTALSRQPSPCSLAGMGPSPVLTSKWCLPHAPCTSVPVPYLELLEGRGCTFSCPESPVPGPG